MATPSWNKNGLRSANDNFVMSLLLLLPPLLPLLVRRIMTLRLHDDDEENNNLRVGMDAANIILRLGGFRLIGFDSMENLRWLVEVYERMR